MSFPDYTTADTSDGTLSIELLDQQIRDDAAIATALDGVTRTDSDFALSFEAEPTAAEQARCDALVAAHSGLEQYKLDKVAAVLLHRDSKLERSVRAEYPAASGKMWSCGATSQNDWSKLVSLQSLGLVGYPFRAWTADVRVHYDVTDSADLASIVTAVSTSVLTERGAAQSVVSAVLAAANEAAADAAAEAYLGS